MKRRLLAAAGAAFLASCRPAGPPRVADTRLPTAEPVVRVGIAVETAAIEVGAEGRYRIVDAGRDEVATSAPDERWTFTADAAGRLLGRATGGRRIGPLEGPVTIRSRDGERPVLIDGRPYRGGALLRAAGPGRVTAVNILDLEAYLLGVVPLEIGTRPATELEAVKAQAVAARTYAVGHLGHRAELGFDFYATVEDQVYGGAGREGPVASRAVRETHGEIVTYDGLPILAYYHSTCGGRTAAIDEVWRSPPLPYLKSVSDRIEGAEDRYYCDISDRFRWGVDWSDEELRRILTDALTAYTGAAVAPIERVETVDVTGHTPSGRAKALGIAADGRMYRVRGDSIRRVLRPEPGVLLNSTLFVLDEEREDAGIRELRATGGGWGHGIGMCQWGAIGRARAGQSYREILATYYRGTEVVRLY